MVRRVEKVIEREERISVKRLGVHRMKSIQIMVVACYRAEKVIEREERICLDWACVG